MWTSGSSSRTRTSPARSAAPTGCSTCSADCVPASPLEEAQADLRILEEPLGKELPMHQGWGLTIDSLREVYVGYLRQPVLVLQGAVFLLLLIACANVAGLLLSQAVARQKELGVRAALGSSRNRILRQLLTENVLLSCAAGVLGIVLAWVGLRAFVNTGLVRLSRSAECDARLDGDRLRDRRLAGDRGPLRHPAGAAALAARRGGGRARRWTGRRPPGPTRSRLRAAFVVAQVALALVLLVATGLLTRSLLRLNAVDTGIDPERLLALQIPMPRALYRNTTANTSAGGLLVEFDSRFSDITERLRERFASVPGVQSVAATTPPPLGGTPRRVLFRKDSWLALADDREPWSAEWYPVSADYFETVQIPVRPGTDVHAPGRTVQTARSPSSTPAWRHGTGRTTIRSAGCCRRTCWTIRRVRSSVSSATCVRTVINQRPCRRCTSRGRSCRTGWTCR